MPIFNPNNPHILPLEQAAPLIENGSLLQYRGNGLFSRFIALGTLGCHTHSAIARKNGSERIDVLEMVEWVGGRAQPLDGQVATRPGKIDVFRVRSEKFPEFSARQTVEYMRTLTSRSYNGWGLLRVAAMRCFGLRLYWLWKGFSYDDSSNDNSKDNYGLFCSHAVCAAYRIGGGVDPVPRKPDYLTTPNDLTWSLMFEYQFTLI